MHGTILAELQKFVESTAGVTAWPALLTRTGLGEKQYDSFGEYPDEEVLRIVSTASEMTGLPVPQLLQAFGEFIAPDLLSLYWGVVKPEWRTLDVIEHTEKEIHSVVRLNNPNASPPYLKAERKSPTEVQIHYSSSRKLCDVAKGICRGLAKHYGEKIEIQEASCMNQGEEACLINVTLIPSSPEA